MELEHRTISSQGLIQKLSYACRRGDGAKEENFGGVSAVLFQNLEISIKMNVKLNNNKKNVFLPKRSFQNGTLSSEFQTSVLYSFLPPLTTK